MSTFDVKYYDDISLSHWVKAFRRQGPTSGERFLYSQLVRRHELEIVESGERSVDFFRSLRWAKFPWGWVIETSCYDEEHTTTIETLVSYNGKTATLVHRCRYNPYCSELKPCLRDDIYPVSCIIRLLPCIESPFCHTPVSAKA